jgi:transcriptional regulator with XRE-family HTH domain
MEFGVSQRALAKRVGVKQPTLCNYENGKRSPKKPQARRLRRITGTPLAAWL